MKLVCAENVNVNNYDAVERLIEYVYLMEEFVFLDCRYFIKETDV